MFEIDCSIWLAFKKTRKDFGRRIALLTKSLKICFCILFVCAVATAVTAVPTVGTCEFVIAHSIDHSGNVSLPVPALTVSSEHELSHIGKAFLQPPNIISGIRNTSLPANKSLPNAPAAVLLGLVGFLCVTAVKDRKEWLAALAAVLWLGQAGLTALPNFISHHQTKNQIQQLSYQLRGSILENSSRLRSEVEGSEYISLLHHLSSIPDDHSNAISFDTSQPVIVSKRDTLNIHLDCKAVQAEQFTCFSPAFIFNNLSRGPPMFA